MGFLPLLPPHDEKVLLFHRKIEGGEGRDQHWLMKESALKKKKKKPPRQKRASSHVSAAPSLSHFCLFPFPPPLHLPPGRRTVEPYQRPYRNFTGRCMKTFFCQCIVISRDAPHNGCQRCLERDSCTSRRFAELSRSVCEGAGFYVCLSRSALLCAAPGRQPAVSYGMWHFPNAVSVSE